MILVSSRAMNLHRAVARYALALLMLRAGPAVPTAFAQEGCVSAQCHATLLKAKTIHPATESCESCHESVAKPHPQKGKKTFKLTDQPPALCAACHELPGKKAEVHPPVKLGRCTACHDPHASNEPKLLVAPPARLCTSCHAEVTTAKHLHGPVSDGECLSCHAAHESDAKPLLVMEAESLCLQCHGDIGDLLKKKEEP